MTKETLIRTVVLAVTLINQILIMFGKNVLSIAESDVYTTASTLVTIGASIWTWWKNNSVTKEAQMADEYMKELKLGVNGTDIYDGRQ